MNYFISYNERDDEHAQWVAGHLEAAGHTTLYMGRDAKGGTNFVEMMDKAVRECDRMIAILTRYYVASDFTKAEWQAFFNRDPSGKGELIVPVRFDDVVPDGLLGQIVYIDLSNVDSEAERKNKLLGGIRIDEAPSQFEKKDEKKTGSVFLHPVYGDQLPYMLDREEVVNHIARLLERQSEDISRPVVCVIHGDRAQSAYMLNWRLRHVEIPNLLSSTDGAVVDKYLNWPSASPKLDLNGFHGHLRDSLSRELVNRLVPLERLRHWVSALQVPLIVRSEILVSEWRRLLNNSLILDYIQFWEDWASKPCQQRVIVFLSIVYDPEMDVTWKDRLRGISAESINDDVWKMLKHVKGGERTIFEVLPRLEGITEQHVQNFANKEKYVGHLRQIHPYIPEMFVRDKYLTMEDAVNRLASILQKVYAA